MLLCHAVYLSSPDVLLGSSGVAKWSPLMRHKKSLKQESVGLFWCVSKNYFETVYVFWLIKVFHQLRKAVAVSTVVLFEVFFLL